MARFPAPHGTARYGDPVPGALAATMRTGIGVFWNPARSPWRRHHI